MKTNFLRSFFVSFLLAGTALAATTGGTSYPPGVLQKGAVTTGHCAQWGGNNQIVDAGAGCAGSSSVTSVTNADGTLTISPTTGAVVSSLALGHVNTWSGNQSFNSGNFLLNGATSGATTLNSGATAGASVLTLPVGTSTLAGLGITQTFTSPQSFNSSDLILKGSVSGTTTLNSGGTAGSSVLTLPVATDTLVGDNTTDTLTNKTLTSGTNTFPTFNQNTTGSAASLTTSRNIYGGAFNGTADVTGIIASSFGGTANGFFTVSGPATSAKTFTFPNASDTVGALGTIGTWTAAQSFASAKFILNGSSSGTTTLNSGAAAGSSVLTLPVATDTLIGKATTDTLTNKTYDTAGTGNSLSINGLAATANTGTGAVVRATSPTLATPTLGVATATSVNFGGNALDSYAYAGSWTPVWTSLTIVGTPTYTGRYVKIGHLVFCTLRITSTTTTASTANTTFFTGLPFTPAANSTLTATITNPAIASAGTGDITSGNNYTPTWAASSGVDISFVYESTT